MRAEIEKMLSDTEALEGVEAWLNEQELKINIGQVQGDFDEYAESSAGWLLRFVKAALASPLLPQQGGEQTDGLDHGKTVLMVQKALGFTDSGYVDPDSIVSRIAVRSPSAVLPQEAKPVAAEGWQIVPIEPTERMVIDGFESAPDETFSDSEIWEAYSAMSGCQQAAYRAKLCWAAMLAAAPQEPAPAASYVEIVALKKEVASLKEQVKNGNAAANLYANAWQRELAAFDGTIRNKRHHIDAMVLTTQDLVATAKKSAALQSAPAIRLSALDEAIHAAENTDVATCGRGHMLQDDGSQTRADIVDAIRALQSQPQEQALANKDAIRNTAPVEDEHMKAALNALQEMLGAFDDGVGEPWNAAILQNARRAYYRVRPQSQPQQVTKGGAS